MGLLLERGLHGLAGQLVGGGHGSGLDGGENLLAYNPPSVIDVSITNPDPSQASTCVPSVASTG